jgi:hypothetical protein
MQRYNKNLIMQNLSCYWLKFNEVNEVMRSGKWDISSGHCGCFVGKNEVKMRFIAAAQAGWCWAKKSTTRLSSLLPCEAIHYAAWWIAPQQSATAKYFFCTSILEFYKLLLPSPFNLKS